MDLSENLRTRLRVYALYCSQISSSMIDLLFDSINVHISCSCTLLTISVILVQLTYLCVMTAVDNIFVQVYSSGLVSLAGKVNLLESMYACMYCFDHDLSGNYLLVYKL